MYAYFCFDVYFSPVINILFPFRCLYFRTQLRAQQRTSLTVSSFATQSFANRLELKLIKATIEKSRWWFKYAFTFFSIDGALLHLHAWSDENSAITRRKWWTWVNGRGQQWMQDPWSQCQNALKIFQFYSTPNCSAQENQCSGVFANGSYQDKGKSF